MTLKSTVVLDDFTLIYQSNGCSATTTIYFCNAGANTVQFSVYAVPLGSYPDVLNAIYFNLPLPCNDTYVLDTEKLVLENGDSLFAKVILSPGDLIGDIPIIATVSAIGV